MSFVALGLVVSLILGAFAMGVVILSTRGLELPRFGGRFSYAAFFTECISSNSIGLL